MKKCLILLVLCFLCLAFASCGHANAQRRSRSGFWSERSESAMTWQEASDYCDSLEEDGFDNWRLPTKHELFEIMKRNEFGTKFGDSAILWSSSESNVSGDLSVVVNFTKNEEEELPKHTRIGVRCIR